MQSERPTAGWDPESSVSYWVQRASRSVQKRLDAGLRPFGFAMSQMPVLRALAGGQSRSQKDLAELARVEQPTMAEMLARMQRDGVVSRTPNPADRRGVLFSLTRRSLASFAGAKAALVRGEHDAVAGFNTVEKALLRELLQRLVDNLEVASLQEPLANAPSRPRARVPKARARDKAT
jgi:MarR family transcriptional regulator, transcriptional regulator for hemolysin